ncbi:MAG: phosphopantetheine-binding protein [Bacteroidales bacterium]|nr:phosphopantetheine-binding protein [Bacteroidales bacterium]
MTQIEIAEKIIPFLVEEFEIERELISPEANLRDTLQLDSLDYVDLVVVIESNFGFKVKQGDFQNLATFEDFYGYVQGKVNAQDEASNN